MRIPFKSMTHLSEFGFFCCVPFNPHRPSSEQWTRTKRHLKLNSRRSLYEINRVLGAFHSAVSSRVWQLRLNSNRQHKNKMLSVVAVLLVVSNKLRCHSWGKMQNKREKKEKICATWWAVPMTIERRCFASRLQSATHSNGPFSAL